MSNLLESILEVLKKNGPSKARKIAFMLDPTRDYITHSDVNSALYQARELKGLSKDNDNVWSYDIESVTKISFKCSKKWLEAESIETVLKEHPNLLSYKNDIEFDFYDKSLLLDCILKILSLINQLIQAGSKVTLKFNRDSKGFTYLQRCGFFDNINKKVEILPFRPNYSLSEIYNANSDNLFEILAINKERNDLLVGRVLRIIQYKLPEENSKKILNKVLNLVGELVDNIYEHGLSEIPGYIVLQILRYSPMSRPNNHKIKIELG